MAGPRYFLVEHSNGLDHVHEFNMGNKTTIQYALKKDTATGHFEVKRQKVSALGSTALAFLYAYSGNVLLQACLPNALSFTSNWPTIDASAPTTNVPPLLLGQKVAVMVRPNDRFTIASVEFSLGFTREPTVQVASSLTTAQGEGVNASQKSNGHKDDGVDRAAGNEPFPASIQVSRSMYESVEVPKLREGEISTPQVSPGGEERVLDTPALESRHVDPEVKGETIPVPSPSEPPPESPAVAEDVRREGSNSGSLPSAQSILHLEDTNQSSVSPKDQTAEDSLPQGFNTVELQPFLQTYTNKNKKEAKRPYKQTKSVRAEYVEVVEPTDESSSNHDEEEDDFQLPVRAGARRTRRNVVESQSSIREPSQTTNSQHGQSLFVLAAGARSSSVGEDIISQSRTENLLLLGEAKTSQSNTAEGTPLPPPSRKRKTTPSESPAVSRKPAKRSKKESLSASSTIEANASFSSLPGTKEDHQLSSLNASSATASGRVPRATATEAAGYTGPTPKIVFSNSSVPDKPNLAKFLKSAGAKSVKAVSENGSNFLCVGPGELKRTSKLTLSVAYGKTIVTDNWVIDSAKAGFLLDPAPYLPHDPTREDAWGFNLKEALQRGEEDNKVLKGWTVHFTPCLVKEVGGAFNELQAICNAAGAESLTKRLPLVSADDLPNTLVIGSENDPDGPALAKLGWTLHSRDLLSLSILRGQLAVDSDEFKLTVVADSQPGRGRRARGR